MGVSEMERREVDGEDVREREREVPVYYIPLGPASSVLDTFPKSARQPQLPILYYPLYPNRTLANHVFLKQRFYTRFDRRPICMHHSEILFGNLCESFLPPRLTTLGALEVE